MLKRILVPLDTSPSTPRAVRLAAEMAQTSQWLGREPVTLVGMSVVDTDQFPAGRFASMVRREELLEEAQARAEELMSAFREQAMGEGVPEERLETRSVTGSPFQAIIRDGVFCDLIVMAPKCSFPPVQHDYDTMAQLYHRSSRPIVLSGQTEKQVERVVMAVDGTAPSSRMMYAYAHLNPFPDAQVTVVYSKEEEEQYDLADFYRRVEEYLKSFHLKAELKGITGTFARELGAAVQSLDAQLLAMGIPVEQFVERFLESIRLQDYPVQRLLGETSAALFTVH